MAYYDDIVRIKNYEFFFIQYEIWFNDKNNKNININIKVPVFDKFNIKIKNEILKDLNLLLVSNKMDFFNKKLNKLIWTNSISKVEDIISNTYYKGLDVIFHFFINGGFLCQDFCSIYYPNSKNGVCVGKFFIDITSEKFLLNFISS